MLLLLAFLFFQHHPMPTICENCNLRNKNKAYRPNAHLLDILVEYNINII